MAPGVFHSATLLFGFTGEKKDIYIYKLTADDRGAGCPK